MNILFTGGSSFTGYWFIKELAHAGHKVTAIFRKSLQDYSGIRHARVLSLTHHCNAIFDCEFGSDKFLQIVESQSWDIFCHHAADVTDYKSANFNVSQALANNTKNLQAILEKLRSQKCKKVVLTGSVFEQNEGRGSENLNAFSPYGLSKGFTWEVFKFHGEHCGIPIAKFVIPNPFGPYEDPRFTTYLIQNWIQGKRAVVNTPSYIRDNIHVSLLAKAYVHFMQKSQTALIEKFYPSGYAESQGHFTKRFAEAMQQRLHLPCEYELAEQKLFPEPRERTNTDIIVPGNLKWNEQQAWDTLATYYKETYGQT